MNRLHSVIAGGLCLLLPAAAGALSFEFRTDYDAGFADAARLQTLQAAGQYVGNRMDRLGLADSLSAMPGTGGSFAPWWDGQVVDPTSIGKQYPVSSQVRSNQVAVPANTILVYVFQANGLHASSGELARTEEGRRSVFTTDPGLMSTVYRGQAGANPAGAVHDVAPWAASMAFDPAPVGGWHVDPGLDIADPGAAAPPGGQWDLFSVAVHELFHVLGFGQSAAWSGLVDPALGFTGTHAQDAYGGPVPLAGSAHWAEGPAGYPTEAAMDPTIRQGQRKLPTDLDLAALRDIGWGSDVVRANASLAPPPVPIPASLPLLLSGVLLLAGIRRRGARRA